jgi:8-oxo-dGTP pyrophosphatase MutT (NUDIX family)
MSSDVSSISAVEAVLRERLSRPLPGAEAQARFAPRPPRKNWQPDQVPAEARRAAALILLYPGLTGPAFPLTVRHHDLPQHAGQVSLPGGGLDSGELADAAALREAEEEIGIRPESVRVIGALSSLWVIVSNFVVYPFIGVTDERPAFRPAAREVAELIEVPLDQLRDRSRIEWGRRTRDDVLIDFPSLNLAGHQVWGATAMILGEFAALFDASFGPARA